MEEKCVLGTLKAPINQQHQQTGEYTSLAWDVITKNIDVRLYSPALGDPLFEEVGSKNYRYHPKNTIKVKS